MHFTRRRRRDSIPRPDPPEQRTPHDFLVPRGNDELDDDGNHGGALEQPPLPQSHRPGIRKLFIQAMILVTICVHKTVPSFFPQTAKVSMDVSEALFDWFTTEVGSVGRTAPDERTAILTAFVNKMTLSGRPIRAPSQWQHAKGATKQSSAEERALRWLVEHDPLQLWPHNSTTYDKERFQQRYALSTLWFQQTSDTRWSQDQRKNWLKDVDECNWAGVECWSHKEKGRVAALDYFNGTIPADLGLLTSLRRLGLGGDTMVGSLPSSLGALTNLDTLSCYGSRLSGTLLNAIGNWSQLTFFKICNSSITGTLPDVIGRWSNLFIFDVSNNKLRGPLPDSIASWTRLGKFAVDNNKLSGTIPAFVGQWSKLVTFTVSNNALTGTIPRTMGEWSAVSTFQVDGNRLQGTIPESLGQWKRGLGKVDFSNNKLTGAIPAALGKWRIGFHTNFSSNRLIGSMPSEICQQFTEAAPYVNVNYPLVLEADCKSRVSCACCTRCY